MSNIIRSRRFNRSPNIIQPLASNLLSNGLTEPEVLEATEFGHPLISAGFASGIERGVTGRGDVYISILGNERDRDPLYHIEKCDGRYAALDRDGLEVGTGSSLREILDGLRRRYLLASGRTH